MFMENEDYKKFRKAFQQRLQKKYTLQNHHSKPKMQVNYMKDAGEKGRDARSRLSENLSTLVDSKARLREMLGDDPDTLRPQHKKFIMNLNDSYIAKDFQNTPILKNESNIFSQVHKPDPQDPLVRNMDSLETKNGGEKVNIYSREEIMLLNKIKQLIRAKRQDPKLRIDIRFSFADQAGGQSQLLKIEAPKKKGFWKKVGSFFGCD